MQLELSGETRVILIIGDPIAQVKSPGLLTARLVEGGQNTIVVPAHVTPADFDAFVANAKLMKNLDGIILTVPHKFAALPHCDLLSEGARFVGSANVMRRTVGGQWEGDNCDGQGYAAGVMGQGFSISGKSVLLVGAGGAGSAIAFEFLERGAARLAVHDADTARRDTLLGRLSGKFPGKVGAGSADPTGFDLVANATPMGMAPGDPLPVLADKLTSAQFVADVITRPEISPLVARAREVGCGTMTGLGMFNGVADRMVTFFSAPRSAEAA